MREITKDLSKIPESLKNSTTEKHFNSAIESGEFSKKSDRYKQSDTKEELEDIYHKKCAYCEKSLLDGFKHIDHFRPKKLYHWLGYSWDNLILSCDYCNVNKRDNFPIAGDKQNYSGEEFSDIHNLSSNYDRLEKPLIINPERDRGYLKHIEFDKSGQISSDDEKVKTTIKESKLNRSELRERREKIFTDFQNSLNRKLIKFPKNLAVIKDTIEEFIEDTTDDVEFYTFRRYILEKPDKFFERNLLPIVKKVVTRN